MEQEETTDREDFSQEHHLAEGRPVEDTDPEMSQSLQETSLENNEEGEKEDNEVEKKEGKEEKGEEEDDDVGKGEENEQEKEEKGEKDEDVKGDEREDEEKGKKAEDEGKEKDDKDGEPEEKNNEEKKEDEGNADKKEKDWKQMVNGDSNKHDDDDDDDDAEYAADFFRLFYSAKNYCRNIPPADERLSTVSWGSVKPSRRRRGKHVQRPGPGQATGSNLKSNIKMYTNDRYVAGIKNNVSDLQQKLAEVLNENQTITKLQHHHTVALQHFEEVESSITETLSKHTRHIKVLQIMLHETRTCRNQLAKQLRDTESKLLDMKDTLQNLERFSKDHSLLEREELTQKLALATAELMEKDKKIQDLEKNFQLHEVFFSNQLVNEQRKLYEERNFSSYLREQLDQMMKETKEKSKKLEESQNYLNHFLKEAAKRGRECKMVQTEGLALLPNEAERLLEFQYFETEEKLKYPSSADTQPVHKKQEDTASVRSEQHSKRDDGIYWPLKRSDDRTDEDTMSEMSETPGVNESKKEKMKKINTYYPFSQAVMNLHHGRPANSSVELSPHEGTEIGAQLFVVSLPVERTLRSRTSQ